MKALVTGAGGFVGRHLCAHLEASGDEVVPADRVTRDGARRCDVTERDEVFALLHDVRPDVVYHLAAFTHVGESWSKPAEVLRVNVEGTLHVLDGAHEAGVDRVVVVGSAEEYGQVAPADVPVREDAPLRPVSPYGVSKVAASFLALQAHLGRGLATVRTRAFNHTGPGHSDRFLVPALARRVAEAERSGAGEIRVGALTPVREVNDVRDVVRAYRLLAIHGEPGEVYNVCSGAGATVEEIATRLLAMAARPLRLVSDPELVRPVEVPRLVGDPSRLRAATGFTPSIPLDDTLAAVLAEARELVLTADSDA